jgi:hypothetical protein
MTYRRKEQSLEKPCEDIINSIESFISAAQERIKDVSWADHHKTELRELSLTLFDISLKLQQLKEGVW